NRLRQRCPEPSAAWFPASTGSRSSATRLDFMPGRHASCRENDKPRCNGGFAAVTYDENLQPIRKSLRSSRRKMIWRRSARAGHLRIEFYAGWNDAGAVLLVFLILLRGGMLFRRWRRCLLTGHRSARETD